MMHTECDVLGFHPAYGLPDDYRLRVLEEADFRGVAATAERHHLSETAIYNWRKAYRAAKEK